MRDSVIQYYAFGMSESELTTAVRGVSTAGPAEPQRTARRVTAVYSAHYITDIQVRLVERSYLVPFQISGGDTPLMKSLIVVVRAASRAGDEVFGVGETTEMTAYTGETVTGLEDVVSEVLAPAVLGCDLFDIAGLHLRMDEAVRGRSVAKAAIDIGVVDAQGRRLGLPAWALLGGRVRTHVELAWVIGLGPADRVVEEATTRVAAGFRHIKLKGGLDPDRDVRLVEDVMRAVPAGTEVALDANGGYATSTVLPALRAMERSGLAGIEQPVPGWDIGGMQRLTAALDMPVMADESLQSVHDAMRLVTDRACDVINIKVLKLGGLYRARQVAAIAEAAGVPVKVGSMPELGIATLAGLHFAAGTPGAVGAADLIGPLMVTDDILTEPDLRSGAATGRLRVPTAPGLGFDADQVFHDADGAWSRSTNGRADSSSFPDPLDD